MDWFRAKADAVQHSPAGLFLKKVLDDQAPNLAALLAWGTLSAMLPLLLGVLSLSGIVLTDPQRLDQIYSTLIALLPSGASGPVSAALEGVRKASAAPAGVIAVVLLLVNGSSFFTNMASVFDQAFHVQPRNFVVERLIAVGMLLLTTALVVLSTLAAGLSGLASWLPGFLPFGSVLATVIGWSVSIVSVFVLFLLMYGVLPNVKQSWGDVMPGALLSSVLLLVVSQVFPVYLTLFPPNQAYALFGVFLVLTFWLYLVGFVFVLGAELNAFRQLPKSALTKQVEPVVATGARAAA